MIYDISPILYKRLVEELEIQREEALNALKFTSNISTERELSKLAGVVDEMSLHLNKLAVVESNLNTLRKNFTQDD